jgi:hypothetical protein
VAKSNQYPNGTACTDGTLVAYANKGTVERVKSTIGVIDEPDWTSGDLKLVNGVWYYKDNVLNTTLAMPSRGTKTVKYLDSAVGNPSTSSTCNDSNFIKKPETSYQCANAGLFGGIIATTNSLNKTTGTCEYYSYGWKTMYGFNVVIIPSPVPYYYCDVYGPKANIVQMKSESDYVRPDGSTFSIEHRNWYQIQP